MTCCQCVGIEREFGRRRAAWELRRYRRRGPSKTTRLLIAALREHGVSGMTLLDIGGGIGAIQHELLQSGVARATSVDASPAYLQTAKDEAERNGMVERVSYVAGDFTDIAPHIEPADLVTLDRVICCYPDLTALFGEAAARAKRFLGLVYPRDNRLLRWGVRVHNFLRRVFRHPFRAYVHPSEAVESIARQRGLRRSYYRRTMLWQVVVYEQPPRQSGDGG